jgi:hypothetical protein
MLFVSNDFDMIFRYSDAPGAPLRRCGTQVCDRDCTSTIKFTIPKSTLRTGYPARVRDREGVEPLPVEVKIRKI